MAYNERKSCAVLITLSLNYDLEHCQRDLARIHSAAPGKCFRGMHGKKMVSVIVATRESIQSFAEKMIPVLSGMDSIDNFWIALAPKPDDIFGKNGNLDPAVHYIRLAWVTAWEWDEADNVRKGKRPHMRVVQRGNHR